MKNLYSPTAFIVGSVLLILGCPAGAENILLRRVLADGVDTYWEVTPEELRDWPRWDTSKQLPLSVTEAVERAFDSLPPDRNKADWQLDSVQIHQPVKIEVRKAYGPVFFYSITLNRKSDDWDLYHCIVSFGGRVIPAKKKRIERASAK